MLETSPVGRHSVYVCTNISCSLRGADELYEVVRAAATEGIDGEPINVRAFECLGACDIAPMASVDGVYVGPLTPRDVPSCSRICAPASGARREALSRRRRRPHANTRDFSSQPAEGGA